MVIKPQHTNNRIRFQHLEPEKEGHAAILTEFIDLQYSPSFAFTFFINV
jgi:hypothetical protein